MTKTPFFRSAAIYQFGGRLLIVPYARTRDGVRRGMAILATASPGDARDIGTKVLTMLAKCEDDVPDDYSRGPAPSIAVILRESKQRSWGAFHKKALLVGVLQEIGASQIVITPTRREGGGWNDIDDKVQITGTDPGDIGRAVQTAFSFAE